MTPIEVAKREFKRACEGYLFTQSLDNLRSYGREIGVYSPTSRSKGDLILEIIAILSGEKEPIERSKKGAPVLNHYVDPKFSEKILQLKKEYFSDAQSGMIYGDIPPFDFEKAYQEMQENTPIMRVADPNAEKNGLPLKEIYRGQLACESGKYALLSLQGNTQLLPIIFPEELVEEYGVRLGDIVACQAVKTPQGIRASSVLSVNGVVSDSLRDRRSFDECNACYSTKRISVYDQERFFGVALKFIDWLLPIGRGQRGCILSMPKAGKTRLLQQLAQAASALNKDLSTFAILVDQSPEAVSAFRQIMGEERLFYTTYDDEADRQVLVANAVLQRAKRMAEEGKDVFLLIDSLSALARAFNNTNDSLGGKTLSCGLESKTIQYVKKYFGAARCLEKGGSITIFATVDAETGDPMDEVIAREVSALSNVVVRLSDQLAFKRTYPTLDLTGVFVKQGEILRNEKEEEVEFVLRNEILPKIGAEGLLRLLSNAKTYKEFIEQIEKV